MLCAASIMLGSTSRRLLSARRAINGNAAMTSGTIEATVPTVVPTIARVSGRTIIINIRNGIERSRLTITLSIRIIGRGSGSTPPFFTDNEQHTERQSDYYSKKCGQNGRIKGLPDAERHLILYYSQALGKFIRCKKLSHLKQPPLQRFRYQADNA